MAFTFRKIPVILILIAVFLTIITVYDCLYWIGDKKIDTIFWLRPVPMIIYTLLWIGATFRNRISAFGFILLTIVHFLLFIYFDKAGTDLHRWELVLVNFMVNPIPVNVLLSVILLLHLRKMKTKSVDEAPANEVKEQS